MEAAGGIGLFVGPIVGGTLYTIGGYATPFFVTTGALALLSPYFMSKLHVELDRISEGVSKEKSISILTLLGNRRISFAALTQVINLILITFAEPILSIRLEDFSISSGVAAIFFAIPTMFYILGAPFIYKINSKIANRTLLHLGYTIIFFSLVLMGPSYILAFNDSVGWIITGLVIMGLAFAFAMIPIMPEMIDAAGDKYKGQESEINDRLSSLYNICAGAG